MTSPTIQNLRHWSSSGWKFATSLVTRSSHRVLHKGLFPPEFSCGTSSLSCLQVFSTRDLSIPKFLFLFHLLCLVRCTGHYYYSSTRCVFYDVPRPFGRGTSWCLLLESYFFIVRRNSVTWRNFSSYLYSSKYARITLTSRAIAGHAGAPRFAEQLRGAKAGGSDYVTSARSTSVAGRLSKTPPDLRDCGGNYCSRSWRPAWDAATCARVTTVVVVVAVVVVRTWRWVQATVDRTGRRAQGILDASRMLCVAARSRGTRRHRRRWRKPRVHVGIYLAL